MRERQASTYLINNRPHHTSDHDFQLALSAAHAHGSKIQCVCKVDANGDGQACYIAKLSSNDNNKFVIKRLPGTGSSHASTCEHYEIDELLSGRSGLAKDAIVEDLDSGLTNIKLKIPLNKKLRPASNKSSLTTSESSSSVTSKQSTLTIIGLLHYLIESVGLNKWSPNMEGKRYYGLVQYLFYKQAKQTIAKRERLSTRFFMPSTFRKDKIEENNAKYFQFLQSLKAKGDNAPIGVFVGKFKEFGSALNFSVLHVKHLGNQNALLIDEKSIPKIMKKHQSAFEMQSVYPELQLFFIATVVNFHDRLKIETIDFMLLTPEFLPLEPYDHDWRLQKQLIEDRRYFEKPLRFSLSNGKPLSTAVLTDTPNTPVALMFDCNLPNYHQNDEDADEHSALIESLEIVNDSERQGSDKQVQFYLPDNMVVIRHDDYQWYLPKQR